MKHIHLLVAIAIAITLVAAGSVVFAHGDEDHAKKGGEPAHEDHASAFGKPGDPKNVSRTVEITMNDTMRFKPARVAVKRNETVRFVLKNEGKLKHEMVLGTIKELKEHAALMAKFPQMEHADPNQASVEPGNTGELVWQFTKAGTFDFACLQAGHFEAGMKGQVVVANGLVPASTLPLAASAQRAPQPAPTADILVAQASGTDMTEGEVRKVDKDAGKHGEIKNLDMPGMTMVFTVKDKTMLDKLQAGDKVKFKAISDGGKITITQIETAQ
jgi:uncharacterized cupredoxin-like copper-binding protein/Cu/Ag efflux protein CusF